MRGSLFAIVAALALLAASVSACDEGFYDVSGDCYQCD